jgi:exodeoxyribonuclease-3
MKLVTWNINSVRLRLPLLLRLIEEQRPDIICLQEIKGENSVFPAGPLAKAGFPHQAVRGMKGYNGVAILAQKPFTQLDDKTWCGKSDARHVAVRLSGGVELHNFYVPLGGEEPHRRNPKYVHKMGFYEEMTEWAKANKGRPVILAGDLNVAPLPDDVWSHKQLLPIITHTPEEVDCLTRLQKAGGWTDAIRQLLPAPQKIYSWWSYRAKDWAASDKGRRLDHIWLPPDIASGLRSGGVLKDVRAGRRLPTMRRYGLK